MGGLLTPVIVALALLMIPSHGLAAVECGMSLDYVGPASTPIWASAGGVAAFYFQSNSDVDTDGSGRSYHPDDPAANKGLAQNIICNGVSRKSNGAKHSCVNGREACQKCLDLFRGMDEATRISRFADHFSSFAIATDGAAACIAPEGDANAGFFVSTTSYLQRGKAVCDPARYLDANTYPAIAVPKSLVQRGVEMGDHVVVRNRKNGRTGFGVVYDVSGGRIGESSVAMNRQLLCQKNKPGCVPPPIPTTLRESYALVVGDVEYLIFKKTVGSWPSSPGAAESEAKTTFESWGGVERLDACGGAYPD